MFCENVEFTNGSDLRISAKPSSCEFQFIYSTQQIVSLKALITSLDSSWGTLILRLFTLHISWPWPRGTSWHYGICSRIILFVCTGSILVWRFITFFCEWCTSYLCSFLEKWKKQKTFMMKRITHQVVIVFVLRPWSDCLALESFLSFCTGPVTVWWFITFFYEWCTYLYISSIIEWKPNQIYSCKQKETSASIMLQSIFTLNL